MKKLIYLLIFPLLFSCNNNEEELKRAKAVNDSLALQTDEKEKVLNDFINSFNEIQDNLNTIKEKENLIKVNAGGGNEMAGDAKDQINEDILTIYKLMLDNKNKINELNQKLDGSNVKIKQFQKMINNLQNELAGKNKEIAELHEKLKQMNLALDNLNFEVDSLSSANTEKATVISEQTTQINTAYYLIGTKKELKKKNILSKDDALIGVGKKLSSNFDKSLFTKVDIRETTEITLSAKKAKLITTHPASSYSLKGSKNSVEGLVIKNPDEFWSVSKYLVIQID